MTGERIERRLAAVLAADVVAFSRLMGADEEGTLARLKEYRRAHIDARIEAHRGRIVKTIGDGFLAEFASLVEAVRFAIAVQSDMAVENSDTPPDERIDFRIGINVGDIIIDGGDIFGDGVNVAARLEALAEPGGICVSDRVREDLRGKFDAEFEDIGQHQLKNIAHPVRVFRVRPGGQPRRERQSLPLPDRPSIAVLPFQNMSGDLEQEYFADGMVEEIITALSRMRWLFVIARNSSFTYKGRAVDVKQVGRELGVRYVLEGSVRRAGNRVRITGQLIDTASGAHLWADRFDGGLEEIFDLQEQVTAKVVGAISPKLEQAEIARAKRKPTGSLDAYDYYLRGMAAIHQLTREAHEEALRLFYRAIELDPDFAAAHATAAYCYIWRMTNGWTTDRAKEVAETERLGRRAVELGRDDAIALSRAGHALGYVVGDLDGGAGLIDLALELNPNLATAWYASGWVRVYRGETDAAIEHLTHAVRLSPIDPEINRMQAGVATGHFLQGRYDEALSWAQRALREQPRYPTALRLAAASAALTQAPPEACRAFMKRLQGVDPTLRLSTLTERIPLRRPEDFARYVEGLRRAGLPE